MILCRTPFRISLFGGGSDYPAWFKQHGGAVLGFAINKYCHISLRTLPPFFEHKHRIVYSKMETANEIKEIQHPAVRAVMSEMKVEEGLEIHHDGDLPARSGLGSSSSFTVGLINAINAHNGKMSSKFGLASEAIRIEQEVIKEHVGSQDQIWAAYGGMNKITFLRDGSFTVVPLIMNKEKRADLISSFMLFFTGISRFASDVAQKKIENLEKKNQHVHKMVAMVDEAIGILGGKGDIYDIGQMLDASWHLKRELADGVTTPVVDDIYDTAMNAGAVGGKLLGAGGGGFILFQVRPESRAKVKAALGKLVHVDFDLDLNGSDIVFYDPEKYYR